MPKVIQLVSGQSQFKPKQHAPKPCFGHQALLPLQILNGQECHIKEHQLPSFFKEIYLCSLEIAIRDNQYKNEQKYLNKKFTKENMQVANECMKRCSMSLIKL